MEVTWQFALLSLFLLALAFQFSSKAKGKLPPSPVPALPVLGHLHFLKFPLHRTIHKLSQELGHIFSLRFGNRLMVVVSSPAIAEECFTKNDIVLSNRPRFIAGKYFGYNYTTLVASPYGEHWRNLRRLTTVEIFSTARLNVFQSIRHDENKLLLKQLYVKSCQDFARVELRSMLSELTFNVIMRMVAGKRYFGEDEEYDEANQFRRIHTSWCRTRRFHPGVEMDRL
ncbi:cytochrome [Sesamum angolense]|uniref:Cytochrome n=1 Tax=Sesamum angolense TaxID=2727404 RepID=A0AAE1WE13_9LAMI|nr:cytochrome [Sesamum angolense]